MEGNTTLLLSSTFKKQVMTYPFSFYGQKQIQKELKIKPGKTVSKALTITFTFSIFLTNTTQNTVITSFEPLPDCRNSIKPPKYFYLNKNLLPVIFIAIITFLVSCKSPLHSVTLQKTPARLRGCLIRA